MTRARLREHAAVQRERYRAASRAEKHRLLDEVVAVTGIDQNRRVTLDYEFPRDGVEKDGGHRCA